MKIIDYDINFRLIDDSTPIFSWATYVDGPETAGFRCGAVVDMSGDEGDLVGWESKTACCALVYFGIGLVRAEELAGEHDVPGEI